MSTATILPFQRHTALAMSVLVLNRSFVAVHVTNVRRALALLFRDVAEVVHIDQGHFSAHSIESWRELSALEALDRSPDQDWIRGVGYDLQAPRVIRLPRCNQLPRENMRFNRKNVFARDANRCQYCNRNEKTCDLIARMCLRETQTAVSTAIATSRQANFHSITLFQRARVGQPRGTTSYVHASPVMCVKVGVPREKLE